VDGITLADVSLQTIYLHVAAPEKPEVGERCNGCGVCCASEPCPLGMWLSRRRHGACKALAWNDEASRYVCKAASTGPRWRRALARRWIGAGKGCDSASISLPG
jgi:hypothetical protein